jgi:hypothetical protein
MMLMYSLRTQYFLNVFTCILCLSLRVSNGTFSCSYEPIQDRGIGCSFSLMPEHMYSLVTKGGLDQKAFLPSVLCGSFPRRFQNHVSEIPHNSGNRTVLICTINNFIFGGCDFVFNIECIKQHNTD